MDDLGLKLYLFGFILHHQLTYIQYQQYEMFTE